MPIISSIFSRILVAVDDSGPARDPAVALAARLAHEHGGKLFLGHFVNWLPLVAQVEAPGAVVDPTPIVEGLREQGKAVLAQAAEMAQRWGVTGACCLFEGDPAKGLLGLAAQHACTLIVMGTHGRHGLQRLVLGSTTETVLRTSTIPVLTVRPETTIAGETHCFERVVVALDDSQPSDVAMQTAVALAAQDRYRMLICSVADIEHIVGARSYGYADIRRTVYAELQSIIDLAIDTARAQGVPAEGRIVEGAPRDALLAVVRENAADLLVMGSHGRQGVRRFFLGSVAESVIRESPVPVLVVRTAPQPAVHAPAPALSEMSA